MGMKAEIERTNLRLERRVKVAGLCAVVQYGLDLLCVVVAMSMMSVICTAWLLCEGRLGIRMCV
jgi:hypothetical protein